MRRVTLNVGLVPGDVTKRLSPVSASLHNENDRLDVAARWAIEKLAGPVFVHRVPGNEDHEPFVILAGGWREDRLDPLRAEVYRLAAYLDQDCIAFVLDGHAGELQGPHPSAWEPFRHELFRTIPPRLPRHQMADPGLLDRLR